MTIQNTVDNLLCQADKSCLLIVDIQTRLTSVMPGKVLDRLERNSTLLLKTAGQLSIPVLVTQQYPQGLGPLVPDIENALPDDSKLFEKTCFSCADADNFMQELKTSGKKQVIIAGIEAHICVLQTAFDLLCAGYSVFVVIDAVCSRQRENYENAISRLQQSGVITCNTESVIFEWLKDSRHEHFKQISALLR